MAKGGFPNLKRPSYCGVINAFSRFSVRIGLSLPGGNDFSYLVYIKFNSTLNRTASLSLLILGLLIKCSVVDDIIQLQDPPVSATSLDIMVLLYLSLLSV